MYTRTLLAMGLIAGVATSSYGLNVIDVYTTANQQAVTGTGGTAYFSRDDFASTGTGVIDPFLRLQANNNEDGMNTSLVGNYLDNKMPLDGYTRDLPLAGLGIVTYNGNQYYKFFLDVNQVENVQNPLGIISLVELRIYIAPQQTTAAQLDALRGTTGNVWDMDAGYDIQIASGNGSGAGDLTVLIPVPAVIPAGSYVYLYSQFGGTGQAAGAYDSDDGFEEWRAFNATPLPPVPDGGTTAMLLGLGLTAVASVRRYFRA